MHSTISRVKRLECQVSGIFRNVVLSVVAAGLFLAGCGKSAYYPGYVSPCVEAKQVREQAERAQGDQKAMLDVKAQGLEEACRSGMNDRRDKQQRFPRQGPSPF
jgi:hypothetical protein